MCHFVTTLVKQIYPLFKLCNRITKAICSNMTVLSVSKKGMNVSFMFPRQQTAGSDHSRVTDVSKLKENQLQMVNVFLSGVLREEATVTNFVWSICRRAPLADGNIVLGASSTGQRSVIWRNARAVLRFVMTCY